MSDAILEPLDVPVVLVFFNRPHIFEKVLSQVRKARPTRLFLIADGPRHEEDRILLKHCQRQAENLDWPCDVVQIYSRDNLGCSKRIATGLDEVFKSSDKAIVLEDDCVPAESFFRFCSTLLLRYEKEPRVMQISGSNFAGPVALNSDYYFTNYPHCWGWATWRRAWEKYDGSMSSWPIFRTPLLDRLQNRPASRYWGKILDRTKGGEFDSWAYRWVLTCWANDGVSINPKVNLVTNKGFGDNATHTKKVFQALTPPVGELTFPTRHPDRIIVDRRLDAMTDRNIYSGGSVVQKVFGKLKSVLVEG